ncbi:MULTISPECIES: DUF7507 domain-containing protein [unclassified Myroides]|uniref:DUF7507 domain-containing protein n=1 Tax=unclassified Myroides TaxID=2642485 RepID=UPI003D2F5E6F
MKKKDMDKKVLFKVLLTLGLLFGLGSSVYAQFLVEESFRYKGPEKVGNVIVGGNPTAFFTASTGADSEGDGWMRLTADNTYEKGFFYINESFPSKNGVFIEFEYKTWRTKNNSSHTNGGDGLSFFLFDAAIKEDFRLGAYGGSLGYAPMNASGTGNQVYGLKGGYIGLGFDEFGNFPRKVDGKGGEDGELSGFRHNVSLRGKTIEGKKNYLKSNPVIGYAVLNAALHGVSSIDHPRLQTNGSRPTDTEFYRKVQLEINKEGSGYRIIVRWATTPNGQFYEVLNKLNKEAPPANLKMGFAGSTGGAINYHEIRNLFATGPGGVVVQKSVDKTIAHVGDELTYTIDLKGQNIEELKFKLNDDLMAIRPFFEVTSITASTNGYEGSSIDIPAGTKTLSNLAVTLGRLATTTITIKGKVIKAPKSLVLTNTATVEKSTLVPSTIQNIVSDSQLTSTVETQIIDDNACGCPDGAIQLQSSEEGQTLVSGKVYCVNGQVTIDGGLTISKGATLIVTSDARLNVKGNYSHNGGLVSICPYGGIYLEGSATMGFGGSGDVKIILQHNSYFSVNGSLTQHETQGGKVNIELSDNSIVEVCATYTQITTTYPVVRYVGEGIRNAYFIVKAEVNGGGASVLTDSNDVNVIAMKSVTDLVIGSSNYCGPNATERNCDFWPVGLHMDSHAGAGCDQAKGIVDKPALLMMKEGKYIQGDRSMYEGNSLEYAQGVRANDLIEYTFKVKNDGNTPILNVKVEDEALGRSVAIYQSGDTNENGMLDVEEEWIYKAIYYVTQTDIDAAKKVNQAIVTGETYAGATVFKKSGTNYMNENPTIVDLPYGAVDDFFCLNEGDPFIAGFHATIIKTSHGFEVFGEKANHNGSHLLTPTRILPRNGFNFKGSPLIASTAGAGANDTAEFQAVLLTSYGLYTWGQNSVIFGEDGIGGIEGTFRQINLPEGTTPRDIRYMTATYGAVALVTFDGVVYIAGHASSLYGDNTTRTNAQWHKVMVNSSTPLTNVKTLRVHRYGAIALTNDNKLYGWGQGVYLGDGTDKRARLFATQMNVPVSNITVKMVAVTGHGWDDPNAASFYALGDNGKMYSLGRNTYGQLGIGNTSDKKEWQTVKTGKGKDLEDIIHITAADNAQYYAIAGAVNKYGRYYSMGYNDRGVAGQNTSTEHVMYAKEPLGLTDRRGNLLKKVVYAEVGGHLNMVVNEDRTFCYIGHKINGSMGDGNRTNTSVSSFDCENTPHIAEICAVLTIEPEPGLKITKDGTYVDLNGDEIVNVGDKITYTLTVENTGDVSLSNVVVRDPKLPSYRVDILRLNVNEKDIKQIDYFITQEDIERGGVFNQAVGQATVNGSVIERVSRPTTNLLPNDPDYPLPDADYLDCETCTVTPLKQTPKLVLVKTGVFDGEVDGAYGNGVINYTFTVKNIGNVSLKTVNLTDDLLEAGYYNVDYGDTNGILETGASWTVTAIYDVTDTDLENEAVSNQAKVVGKSPKDKETEANSGTEIGNENPTITPVEGGGPLITNPHIYHKVQ